ncbi:hypothetical protein SAMN05216238_101459 [Lentibacillus persicus]|uniref:Lipoprotein n=1 Tax=Lentibacillus persicus TaxID=640948 RepID=A0A1I1SK11_9BACI|nr:hypothetical protein [Lentibacillus persicus]SFD46642.1 hypothetical protein SAMN05216238_101459 [Lentibacillus persicus]
MGKKIFTLMLLMLLTGCDEEPAIVQSDTPSEDAAQVPEIIEQEKGNGEEEEVDEFIEFVLPKETIMINLKMVPILDSYLTAVDDRQQAIAQMTLLPIQTPDRQLFLLEFSCHESNSCSYLLLDQTEENRTYLIADLATLVQKTASPDMNKVLFHFNREESRPALSDIVVIDLNSWEAMTLHNKSNDKDVLNYTWPLLNVEWTQTDRFTVTVPDIAEPTTAQLKQWENGNKPEEKIEFHLNETEQQENDTD